jgi:hypothetical protein
MNFEELKAAWEWAPIRNCPGRFTLRGGAAKVSPAELVGDDAEPTEFRVGGARDPVVVCRCGDGGLISYRKGDNTYLHTLNTAAGFERKLTQLGISLSAGAA